MTTPIKNLVEQAKTVTYKIAKDPEVMLTVTITQDTDYVPRDNSDAYKPLNKHDMSFTIESENEVVHQTQPLRFDKSYQDLFVAIKNAYKNSPSIGSLTKNQSWNKLTEALYEAADPEAVKREREEVSKKIDELQKQLAMYTEHLNRLGGANSNQPESDDPFWGDDDYDDTF